LGVGKLPTSPIHHNNNNNKTMNNSNTRTPSPAREPSRTGSALDSSSSPMAMMEKIKLENIKSEMQMLAEQQQQNNEHGPLGNMRDGEGRGKGEGRVTPHLSAAVRPLSRQQQQSPASASSSNNSTPQQQQHSMPGSNLLAPQFRDLRNFLLPP